MISKSKKKDKKIVFNDGCTCDYVMSTGITISWTIFAQIS